MRTCARVPVACPIPSHRCASFGPLGEPGPCLPRWPGRASCGIPVLTGTGLSHFRTACGPSPAGILWRDIGSQSVTAHQRSGILVPGGDNDHMPGRASDLITIPGSFWQRAETIAALRNRDIGRLFQLLRQYAGASQTQIAIACQMSQSKVSNIMRGEQAGPHARAVRPHRRWTSNARSCAHQPRPGASHRVSPSRTDNGETSAAGRRHPGADTGPGLQSSPRSDVLDVERGGKQEDDDPVQRRTFVGLTGASMFSAILADTAQHPPARQHRALRTGPRRHRHRARLSRCRPRPGGIDERRPADQARLPGVPPLRPDQVPSSPAHPPAHRIRSPHW